ncbi:putative sugar transferase EpsL [Novipirellula aureliae]|uniref:Putative sugar transferase EpsL n=1 Tax=Novipirellula aureliae TaxID=2527966 RepID=A0A5C6DL54_9BACT|nr:exopolysaccharide biosynthesis polyprenyl glycosylphosphotransferase [Novipirellula aureliae]TWU37600.1 putative sugar transferase EpsL [Novipirellula aureliae]
MIQRPAETIRYADASELLGGPISIAPTKTRAFGPESAELETIIARHTAIQPSRMLRAAYTLQSFSTGLPIFLLDLVASALCLVFACYLVNLHEGHPFNRGIWFQIPIYLLLQSVFFSLHQLYPGAGLSPVAEIRGVVRSAFMGLIILSTSNLVLGQLPRIEFAIFVFAGLCICALIPLTRGIARRILSKTSWWGMRLLLVGNQQDCTRAMNLLNRRGVPGYRPVGFTSNLDRREDTGSSLGHNNDAATIGRQKLAPVVCLVSPKSAFAYSDRLVFQFPSVVWLNTLTVDDDSVDTSGLPGVVTHGRTTPFLRFFPRVFKRAVDLLICIPLLVLLALPMAIIALAIRVISPGPIFYGSVRAGQHGKSFRMWKFRSMVPNADEVLRQRLETDEVARAKWQVDHKLKEDPRIIPGIGSVLRSWSLDELPQLWNVLVGEMSLVGPRPVPPDEIVLYASSYYEYTQMWPGITGLWQVSGRNDTNFETRLFLVHHYAINWSPWLDAWILLRTPAAVLMKRGAY